MLTQLQYPGVHGKLQQLRRDLGTVQREVREVQLAYYARPVEERAALRERMRSLEQQAENLLATVLQLEHTLREAA